MWTVKLKLKGMKLFRHLKKKTNAPKASYVYSPETCYRINDAITFMCLYDAMYVASSLVTNKKILEISVQKLENKENWTWSRR